MSVPNADKRIDVPMIGISYSQWVTIMAKFPYPENDGPGEVPPAIKAAKEVSKNERKLALLEAATGMTIPGADIWTD